MSRIPAFPAPRRERTAPRKPGFKTARPTDNPYQQQPARAFWRPAVTDVAAIEMTDLYQPRFEITHQTRIAAAGSCFASHIARQFRARGFRIMDFEPAPPMLDPDTAESWGYGQYSARFGHVYSMRQLLQLFERAEGRLEPQDHVWLKDGRAFDPFRPTIQPGGFASVTEMEADRDHHLQQVRGMLAQIDLFVFTFGLTEAWLNRADGAALPSCPGTHAGTYDPARYHFCNFRFADVLRDAEAFIEMARAQNPEMRFVFTVSPVPLTATATDQHVLAATTYSKSVLRAVCGELAMAHDFVDYFPAYELVASHPMRAIFYRPDMRNVAAEGVARVMDIFFRAHGDNGAPAPAQGSGTQAESDTSCDEEILDFFRS